MRTSLSQLALLLIIIISFTSRALSQAVSGTMPYGQVDTADLKLTECGFEKDANAMVLFDKAEVNTGFASTVIKRHKRIKIFNKDGESEANVHIEYYSGKNLEEISDVEAETINLEKNEPEFTKVEKRLIYHEKVDRNHQRVVFTFPRVKEGSIIEYSYKITMTFVGGFPHWNFQGSLPVRYSEFNALIRSDYAYKIRPAVYQPYTKNTWEVWKNNFNDTIGNKYEWAVSNIPSYRDEPYSSGPDENMEGIEFRLVAIKLSARGEMRNIEKTWHQIGGELADDPDFVKQVQVPLKDEDKIINEAKLLKNEDERINFIFDTVRNRMHWNNENSWYTIDGIKTAWEKNTGNVTEINLILDRLLDQAGIKCCPMVVSTRDNGKVNKDYPHVGQFNKTVVYIARGQGKSYILDATDSYGAFTDVPFDILNSHGLIVDPVSHVYVLFYLQNETPSRKTVLINAEIKPEGKLEGTAQINEYGYNRSKSLKLYNTLGEQKYIEKLKNAENTLEIKTLKLENSKIDTLPLTEDIQFKLELTSSDGNYLYFNPNLFTTLRENPFLSEVRHSDVDFGCLNYYNINGRYKIPAGFKVDVLPKTLSLLTPDKSISFKRMVAEDDGEIIVHYVIEYKKSTFSREDYSFMHEFYKKMYEMLNEQIVLKKS